MDALKTKGTVAINHNTAIDRYWRPVSWLLTMTVLWLAASTPTNQQTSKSSSSRVVVVARWNCSWFFRVTFSFALRGHGPTHLAIPAGQLSISCCHAVVCQLGLEFFFVPPTLTPSLPLIPTFPSLPSPPPLSPPQVDNHPLLYPLYGQ